MIHLIELIMSVSARNGPTPTLEVSLRTEGEKASTLVGFFAPSKYIFPFPVQAFVYFYL